MTLDMPSLSPSQICHLSRGLFLPGTPTGSLRLRDPGLGRCCPLPQVPSTDSPGLAGTVGFRRLLSQDPAQPLCACMFAVWSLRLSRPTERAAGSLRLSCFSYILCTTRTFSLSETHPLIISADSCD